MQNVFLSNSKQNVLKWEEIIFDYFMFIIILD